MYNTKKYELYLKEVANFEYNYTITNADELSKFCIEKLHLDVSDRERAVVIAVNTKGTIVGVHDVSIGDLHTSIVHPANVFKFCIMTNASAFFFAHNHPSGDVEPSNDDYSVTERLRDCGQIMGIKLMDHVIVGHGATYSFVKNDSYLF